MPDGWITIALAVGILALIAWQATTNLRLNRMVRHYRGLSAGVEGLPLDQLLGRILERSDVEARELEAIRAQLGTLLEASEGHLQKVGMVRYNAFSDTGGDQSFALALLDANGNGAIFNGLYHRNDCRIYAKPVKSWKSIYSMSDEENEAVRRAREGE